MMKHNEDPTEEMNDDTESQVKAESAEASFPAPEEVRSSFTSRNGKVSISKPSRKRQLYVSGCVIVLMLVITIVSIVISQRNNQRGARVAKLVNYLVDEDASDADTFDDSDSPQYRAAQWLANEDTADLPIYSPDATDAERYSFMFRYVMAVHFFALGGEDWDVSLKFLTGADVCDWKSLKFGVLCRVIDGREVPSQLVLARNGLNGQLPAEIGKLTTLEGIDFSSNALTGTIPPEVCSLKSLTYLIVSKNMIEGSIPDCVGFLSNMVDVAFSDNLLEGTLPSQLGNLKKLKQFYCDDNNLSGNPFKVFNQLTAVTHLMANGNDFEGAIDATSLANSPHVHWVDLSHNKFTGSISSRLLSLPLNLLDLSKNVLTGVLPTTIAENTKLEWLALYGNRLTGSVAGLVNLKRLTHLDVSMNRLSGSMDAIGSLPRLANIFLADNSFTRGPVPTSFSSLVNLTELSLRNTNRNGPLPALSKQIKLLDLSSNQLTGSIPATWNQAKLSYVLLNNNTGITGTIPDSFLSMTSLRGVVVDGTTMDSRTMEKLCRIKMFQTVDKKYDEILVADCRECSCDGCTCCLPGMAGGCSRPLLANLDGSWENEFRRAKYEMRNITADLENSIRSQK